ncbi:MAG TPA: hypothetical protein VF283_15075 [Bryobacteraceae bacterium]
MKQALHIFKKDVRHFRYDIGLTLLVVLAFCIAGARNMRGPGSLAFALPVCWWFLIARVIHAEALPGNRQFWLTRPYEWKSLLGAKILFIFSFVNLPLLVADAVIVHSTGFSLTGNTAGLLWTQALLIVAFVLPVAALSAITSGLPELLVVTLLLIVIALARVLTSPMIHWGFYWMQLEWVKTYYLVAQIAAAALIILFWQYARRKTFATRIVAAATVFVFLASGALLPWTAAFALETHLSSRNLNSSAVQIKLDSNRKWLGRIYIGGRDRVVAELPLQISGLPAGTQLQPNGLTVTVRASDGETWVVKQPAPDSFDFENSITSLQAEMPTAFYAKVRSQPVQLRGTLYFTLYGGKRSTPIPLNGGPVSVKGAGLCSAGQRYVLCNSAFRTQADLITFRFLQDLGGEARSMTDGISRIGSYSPFPADLHIDPIVRFFSPRPNAISAVAVETWEPLAHLERDFEINGVRLDSFAANSALARMQ